MRTAHFLNRPAADILMLMNGLVPLTPATDMLGRQLGSYKISGLVGSGGMGEIYRARDSKLGRDVAIKVLPAQLTSDPERRARLAREARLLATLNHPHVGAIYGLEETDGVIALVLELVEGPTLAERLARGPVPVAEALVISRQIAAALDAAHEKGVVHRDLKPANIVLQGETGVAGGEVRARVLDFGLATTMSRDVDPDSPEGRLVSLTGPLVDGRILGTLAYMSPEQIRGQPADKRMDIWAFGCVMFEMLAGKRPFVGSTVADTFARILDHEPDWSALPAGIPGPTRKLLERCLRKDPRQRLRDIADAVLEVDESAPPSSATTRAVERTRRGELAWVLVGALTIVLAWAAVAFVGATRGQGGPGGLSAAAEPALVRLTSNPADMSVTSAHISPDGRYLAFADATGVQVRMIDSGTVHRLADTKGMNVYGWTSDSAGVLSSQCDELQCTGWVVSLVGQERRRTGAMWPRDDPAVVSVRVSPDGLRLLRLAVSMTPRTLLVDPMNGVATQRLATGDIIAANWSADGQRVLFVRRTIPAIESVSAEGGPAVEVFRAPKDQVIVDAIELRDRSILFTMMPPGSAPGPTTEIELWKAETDPTGRVSEPPRRLTRAATGASHLNHLSASASGQRVAFVSTSYQTDVYVADGDIRGGVINGPRRFTLSDRDDTAWQWAPDSRSIIFSSTRNGSADVFKQPLESEVAEPLITGPGQQDYAGVSGDSRWLLYMSGPITGDDTVMRVPMSGGASAEVVRLVGRQRLQCTVHGRCALLESKDGFFVISSLDPVKGKGVELARAPLYTWGFRVLPDGDAFAYILPPDDKGVRNRVRVISFSGKPPSDVIVKDAARLSGVSWLASDSGFLSTDRGKLLLVSRDGTSKVLWSPSPPMSASWAVPSPDEKHLAINVLSRQSNAWMITGF